MPTRSGSARSSPRRTASWSPAWPTTWSAALGRRRPASSIHELRGHKEKTPNHFRSMLYAVAFSPDGKLLATGDKVGHVVVWDVETGKQVGHAKHRSCTPGTRCSGCTRSAASVRWRFRPDGKQLAVGGIGKIGNIDHLEAKARVEVFDWKAGKPIAEFVSDKQGIVNRLEWSPCGSWLLGAGGAGEGFLLFHDVAGKKTLRQEKLPMHTHDFHLTDDCRELVCVGHNRITRHALG